MKPRLRYPLIAIFFLAFLVLAPFVVSFVTGIKYDSGSHKFVRTGSIYVKTQPNKAQIFLNGKLYGNTPATLRFLAPGDYQVLIKKNGYFDWSKTLNVRAQYVTYVNQDIDDLTMFLSQPKGTQIAQNVLDFYSGKKRILYVTADKIFIADVNSPEHQQGFSLQGNFSPLNILASPDENYYLIYNGSYYAVFDARNNKIFDISSLINSPLSTAAVINDGNFQFSDRDDLYFLTKTTLYQVDWQNTIKTAVAQNIFAYQINAGSLYALSLNAVSGMLQLSQGNIGLNQTQNILISGLPNFKTAQIFVSNRNQPFILGDGVFYAVEGVGKASNSLRRITDSISFAQLNDQNSEFILASNNEIDIYDYLKGTFSSVTRSSAQIKTPQLLGDLGWILYLNDGSLQTIELDNRDRQNNYQLSSVGLSAKYYIGPNLDKIFLLDNGKLSELGIR